MDNTSGRMTMSLLLPLQSCKTCCSVQFCPCSCPFHARNGPAVLWFHWLNHSTRVAHESVRNPQLKGQRLVEFIYTKIKFVKWRARVWLVTNRQSRWLASLDKFEGKNKVAGDSIHSTDKRPRKQVRRAAIDIQGAWPSSWSAFIMIVMSTQP